MLLPWAGNVVVVPCFATTIEHCYGSEHRMLALHLRGNSFGVLSGNRTLFLASLLGCVNRGEAGLHLCGFGGVVFFRGLVLFVLLPSKQASDERAAGLE